MRKFSFFVLSLCFLNLFAQAQDTLWVKTVGEINYIEYTIQSGDDLFSIAKQFKVPPALLADFNNTNFTKGISIDKPFYIPIGPYNFNRSEQADKYKKLYYKVDSAEDLRTVSRKFNLSQSQIQIWNSLSNPNVNPQQVLHVGWIAYGLSKEKIIEEAVKTKVIEDSIKLTNDLLIDSLLVDSLSVTFSAFEQEYEDQTNRFSLNTESGAAVFYPLKIAQNGSFYALANLPKGTIIKVESPATGRVIYAKVLGELPKINKYNNAIIGLSDNAAEALSISFERFFCKISYR